MKRLVLFLLLMFFVEKMIQVQLLQYNQARPVAPPPPVVEPPVEPPVAPPIEQITPRILRYIYYQSTSSFNDDIFFEGVTNVSEGNITLHVYEKQSGNLIGVANDSFRGYGFDTSIDFEGTSPDSISFTYVIETSENPDPLSTTCTIESWVQKEGFFGMIKIEGVTDTCAEGHIRIHFYDGPPEMPATNFLGIISDIYFTGYAFSAESSSSGNPFLMADYLKTLENLNFNYYIYEL